MPRGSVPVVAGQRTGVCHGRSRYVGKGREPLEDFRCSLDPGRARVCEFAREPGAGKTKTRDELLKQAIDVVFLNKTDRIAGDSKSFESRRAHRSHWLEIYNSLADVKLSNEFIAIMMEQDTIANEKDVYWTGN